MNLEIVVFLAYFIILFFYIIPHRLRFVNMFFYDYYIILLIYTQIQYSPFLSTTTNLIAKVVRTLLSVVIFSPFCTEFGQLAEGAGCFIVYLIIRFVVYKVNDGKLFIKKHQNLLVETEKKQDE